MVSEPHSSLRPTALGSCSPGPSASWPLIHRQATITSLRGPRWSPSLCPQPHQGPPPASSCVPSPVSGPATHTLRAGLLAPHPPSLACRSLSASPHFLPPGSLHSGHPAVGRPPAGTGAGLPVTPDRVPTLLAGSPGSLALCVTVGLIPFFPPLSLIWAPKLGVVCRVGGVPHPRPWFLLLLSLHLQPGVWRPLWHSGQWAGVQGHGTLQ